MMADAATAHVLFDEFGQPFILLRDQEKQKRLTGIEALKVIERKVLDFHDFFGMITND